MLWSLCFYSGRRRCDDEASERERSKIASDGEQPRRAPTYKHRQSREEWKGSLIMRMHRLSLSGFVPAYVSGPLLQNPITGGMGDLVRGLFSLPQNPVVPGLSGCRSCGVGTTTTTPPSFLTSLQTDITTSWADLQSMKIAGIGGGVLALGLVGIYFLSKKRR